MPTFPARRLSDHIVEVRFKPRADLVDVRGELAAQLSEKLDCPDWSISDNRVEVVDKRTSRLAFVSHRNFGCQFADASNQGYLSDQAVKAVKHILEAMGQRDPLTVPRLGARSRFAVSFQGRFEELRERFIHEYATPTAAVERALGGALVDVGFFLNRADSVGNFNTMTGPMSALQVKERLDRDDNLPDVALYFEIDYWLKPTRPLAPNAIIEHVRAFTSAGWQKFEAVCSMMLPETLT